MSVRSLTTNLIQQFRRVLGVIAFSFFPLQMVAHAAPVIVSVDHRVTVTYSVPKFDGRKGVYTTHVRIKNHSGAALYSPLRLAFVEAALKNIRLLNAQGIGKDGLPYFEFTLPNEILSANSETKPIKVSFTIEKDKKALKVAH